MIKVIEIRGLLFSATLSDGSNLCLQPSEEVTIKDSLVSESLTQACKKNYVSIIEVESTKPTTKDKTGGATK